jgi:hypothetical protein
VTYVLNLKLISDFSGMPGCSKAVTVLAWLPSSASIDEYLSVSLSSDTSLEDFEVAAGRVTSNANAKYSPGAGHFTKPF